MADALEAVGVDALQELEGGGILDQMIDTGIKPSEDGRERAVDLIKNFVSQILDPGTVVDKNVVKTINARIAAIDEVMSKQVDAILHNEKFRKLEGSWRGLNQLVMNTETSETLKIQVLNVSKKELKNDFDAAAEFTESGLWKKVY